MKSSILRALAVAFGFSLLFGVSAADATIQADVESGLQLNTSGECGGCTITYEFDKEDCVLTRTVSCSTERCITVPGMDVQECKKKHESSLDNVTVTTALGQAKISACDENDSCSGPTAVCDISYHDPTIKPVEPADPATGTASLIDEDGNVTALVHSVTWDGTAIHYQVTNESTTGRNVFWFDTPINGDFLAPGETLVRSVTALTQPLALFRPIEAENPDGGRVVLDAVTFVVSAEAEPVPVQQALP